jgi:hypothetical protein
MRMLFVCLIAIAAAGCQDPGPTDLNAQRAVMETPAGSNQTLAPAPSLDCPPRPASC